MAFTVALTSALTGATERQLGYWRRTTLLEPEVSPRRPILYSFRDVLALRTVVRLRQDQSLGRIRSAFAGLPELDFTDHPSRYTLVSTGSSIYVEFDGRGIDLVSKPGHVVLASLDDIMAPFEATGRNVVDFRRPRPHLRVREQRLGGWPTIEGTRVPYNTVAELLADGTVPLAEIGDYYPGVTPEAASDALDFARSLADWHEPAAA